MRILLIITGHTIEPVRSQFENTDSHFSRAAGDRAKLVPYAICEDETLLPPPLDEFDGVIMTGSAAMVGDDHPWIRLAKKMVGQCIMDDIPYLGVCFGHQILGSVCGAQVGPNPNGRRNGTTLVEVTRDSPLFRGMPKTFYAQVSHRDVVLEDSPEFHVIATTAHDPHHSIQVGTHAFGVQFHPEWGVEVSRAYLDARKEVLGAETYTRLKETLKPSPEAHLVVQRFLDCASG
jgi:GMP synthase (glutamine-hydrolysing)